MLNKTTKETIVCNRLSQSSSRSPSGCGACGAGAGLSCGGGAAAGSWLRFCTGVSFCSFESPPEFRRGVKFVFESVWNPLLICDWR
jgi:hypothetical protein